MTATCSPDEAAALDGAAEHPVHAAVPVIGAVRAVLAERPAELREHDDDGLVPGGAHLLGEAGEALAEAREQIRQLPLRVALVDVRVPAADVDEADVELVVHQPGHAARLELEALAR